VRVLDELNEALEQTLDEALAEDAAA